MASSLLDVTTQLTFYGAYHSNRINVLIHIICLPILHWSFHVLATQIPVPPAIPVIHHKFNDYLIFDLNWSAIQAALYLLYYLALEPVAAMLFVPQTILSVLTATAFARNPNAITQAALLHGGSWVAQFMGHGLAEKRSPALLDNFIGAVVLAPFFVHLELLFAAGYRPEFHRRVKNQISKEITRIRKAQGEEKRRKGL